MKDFLSITDLTAEQIESLVKKAIALKADLKKNGGHSQPLRDKSMAMIFDKPSWAATPSIWHRLISGWACANQSMTARW